MIWFDSHAHLQDDDFANDWRQTLDRAAAAGIGRILLPASDLADSRRAIAISLEDDRLCCSIGCHPHAAAGFGDDGIQQLQALLVSQPGYPIVAIGETGLDYHYDFSPRPTQRSVFQCQLDLAFNCGLPLIIHEREATADCLAILQEQSEAHRLLPCPGVFHCFSGSPETAEILLALGFYIGVDGPITFKNARKTPDVIRICPKDRLLLETDSPYLTPVPYRGQRNEPAYLPLIGEKVAEIWKISTAEVARITFDNAMSLFRLASRA